MREEKIEFMATHLGQDVIYPDADDKEMRAKLVTVGYDNIQTNYKRKRKGVIGDELSWKSKENTYHESYIENVRVMLKPLTSITDEHAKEVFEILIDNPNSEMELDRHDSNFISVIKADESEVYMTFFRQGIECWFTDVQTEKDYEYIDRAISHIRKLGYAYPWRGHSVEEQQELGWINK